MAILRGEEIALLVKVEQLDRAPVEALTEHITIALLSELAMYA